MWTCAARSRRRLYLRFRAATHSSDAVRPSEETVGRPVSSVHHTLNGSRYAAMNWRATGGSQYSSTPRQPRSAGADRRHIVLGAPQSAVDAVAAEEHQLGGDEPLDAATTASANLSKGARGPEDWRPDARSYWCQYAIDWIAIKSTWELTVTQAEGDSLEEMLNTCREPPNLWVSQGSTALPQHRNHMRPPRRR